MIKICEYFNQINILLENININIDKLQYKNIAINFILRFFYQFCFTMNYFMCKIINYVNYIIKNLIYKINKLKKKIFVIKKNSFNTYAIFILILVKIKKF